MWVHPCLRCGACCATFRVSFYRGELLQEGDRPRDEEVVDVTPFRVAMRGTEQVPPRCHFLEGNIGAHTPCRIYERRPSPCREFAASLEDETPHERCDQARLRHGLAPLTAADWIKA